jgi:polygalacturonase
MILDINIRKRAQIAAILGILPVFQVCQGHAWNDPWEEADEIVGGIALTSFPDRTFNIRDQGAVAGDGLSDWQAIEASITACATAGGGRVLVPPGVYDTGPITLLSDVNLHLEEGAILRFSTRPEDYLPAVRTRWEGVDCYNYAPLVYARGCTNVAITGRGSLDGQANNANWWWWKGRAEYGWSPGMSSQADPRGRPRLLEYMEKEVPVEDRHMGEGGFLRPPFIQFLQCNTVLVEDITVKDSPFWLVHPLLSESVIVRGLKAMSHGPNNDGCNPESCKNVLIEQCYFDTGDDCIAVKSGRNGDGRRWAVPSENIVIRDCEMKNGHGGVVLGSEISGGCRNIFVENCLMNSPDLERAIRIKTNSFRGGIVENLFVRNVEVGVVDEAVIKINCLYEIDDGDHGDYPPLIRNISIENMVSEKSEYALYIQGIKQDTVISKIVIDHCSFNGVERGNYIEYAEKPELRKVYINKHLVVL